MLIIQNQDFCYLYSVAININLKFTLELLVWLFVVHVSFFVE